MKKTFFIAIILMSYVVAIAQPSKGKYSIGGNFSFLTGFNGAADEPKFSFDASAGYFTGNNNQIGLSVGMERLNYLLNTDKVLRIDLYTLSFYNTKYFPIGEERKFFGFLEGRLTGFSDFSNAGFDIGVSGGFSYFPVPNVGINLTLGSLNYTALEGLQSGELSFNGSTSNTGVGVTFLLGRKKRGD